MSHGTAHLISVHYHIYPKYSDRQDWQYSDGQDWAKSVDPDKMLQNTVSDQVYTVCHSSSNVLDTSSGSKEGLFKVWGSRGGVKLCDNYSG